MGTSKIANVQPLLPMAENDKKSLKKLLKVFFKKDKKKVKIPEVIEEEKPKDVTTNSIAAQTVENILEKIKKLEIKDQYDDELANFSYNTVKDEPKNAGIDCSSDFSFKIVKEEGRNDRSDSHSSEDSGFAEKADEGIASDGEDDHKTAFNGEDDHKGALDEEDEHKDDEVIVALKNLNLEEEKGKEKRVQNVVVGRGPLRPKVDYKSAPYYVNSDPCRQIQINRQTLTGGQVIVNRTNDFLAVDAAFKEVQQTSQHSQHEHGEEWFSIVAEVIQEDSSQPQIPEPPTIDTNNAVEDILSEFFQSQQIPQNFYQTETEASTVMSPPHQESLESNPIEEFSNHLNYEIFGELDLTSLNAYVDLPSYKSPNQQFIFPTPPHSENAASPMSDSQGSYQTSHTYSTLHSPERSSPISHSDYEKFQEISHNEEYEEKSRRNSSSSSSMTMKQYKDLQKEIAQSFSKKDCCQLTRKSCKQLFQEHLQKVPVEERRNLCLKVAKMDLKHAYGVLQNILISLSQSTELEDVHYALVCLICERVLSQSPGWYVGDFGLNLLKSAALRCPTRPLLTRYLVQCVRAAIRADPAAVQGKDSVFHEVDAQGDTLVTALARRGDAQAGALAELVRADAGDLPLFRVHHVNADGASALHVACSEHAASAPRLHVVHTLLEHAGADLWQGDAKAGDTAVHMAVNSKSCDLRLLMVLFRHEERKLWKKLAHAPNKCSTTPLEYARSATKSQVRDGYPPEVLEFLKKCR